MKDKIVAVVDFVIYWSILLIPFTMAIAIAPMSIFMGLLIACFLAKKALTKQKLFIYTPVVIPFLAFFVICTISVINTINLQDSIRGLIRYLQYLFIFLIMAEEIKDKKYIQRIVISLVAGLCLVSIDAVWQVITGKDFIRGNSVIINIGLRRATAAFSDANVLGIYISAIIPLILGLAIYHFKKNKNIIIPAVSFLGLTGLTLTYSRPTLLALYLSLLFLAIFKKDKVLIVVLIIAAVISPFIAPRSIKDYAKEVNYNPVRFMCNDDRIAIYKNSFNMIKAHPVIGVGVNTFMKNYKRYKEFPEYRNIITPDLIYAHDNFIQMAGETGLSGLAIFICFLYVLFREIAYIFGSLKDEYHRIVLMCLCACLIAFLINGLTESSFYYSRVAVMFWFLIGFSLSFKKFVGEEAPGKND